MLKKFTVSNYRQFNEPLEFDLTAGGYTFNPECVQNDLVKLALIYGENGTGKSSLGWAIFDLVSHLTDNKYKSWTYDCVNAYSSTGVVVFEFHFVFFENNNPVNVIYQYKKQYGQPYGILFYELLKIDNEVIIEYNLGMDIYSKLSGFQTLVDKTLNPYQNLSAIKYLYRNIKIGNSDFYDIIFNKFFEFCNKIAYFGVIQKGSDFNSHIGYYGMGNYSNIGEKIINDGNLDDLQKFLFDNGLDFNLIELERNGKRIGVRMGGKDFFLFDIASSGTHSLIVFYYWIKEIEKSNIPLLFIDEFDCSYHFDLSEKIVEKLKQLSNTQVILTTHNTNLLSNELIRPDCGFVIDGKQIKSLNKLTVRELRYAHNLERMYQAGEFDND